MVPSNIAVSAHNDAVGPHKDLHTLRGSIWKGSGERQPASRLTHLKVRAQNLRFCAKPIRGVIPGCSSGFLEHKARTFANFRMNRLLKVVRLLPGKKGWSRRRQRR